MASASNAAGSSDVETSSRPWTVRDQAWSWGLGSFHVKTGFGTSRRTLRNSSRNPALDAVRKAAVNDRKKQEDEADRVLTERIDEAKAKKKAERKAQLLEKLRQEDSRVKALEEQVRRLSPVKQPAPTDHADESADAVPDMDMEFTAASESLGRKESGRYGF